MAATEQSIKDKAHALIDKLPENATWADVAETLEVIADIEAGLAESDAGLGADTTTLRKRFMIQAAHKP